jgi:hypothetical protein
MARRGYPKIRARLPDGGFILPVGREAMTLLLLVEKGDRGLRAYDFPGGPPFRLAAYICDLRSEMGLTIDTRFEKHATGDHAVYTLRTAVRIEAVQHEPMRAAS